MQIRTRTFLVFLLALVFYLPLNSYLPITDPVEANYALTAKEMLLSGDWLSPRIYGQFWFDKPVMIYWLIAISYKIFGITEFAARFPAGVFSAGSVAFAYWFANRLFYSRRTGILSAIVLATSLEFSLLAKMIITDAVLFFFSSVSLAVFYLGLREEKKFWYVIAYVTAGLAVLTKGPIGLLLPGLIVFSYIIVTRQWVLFTKLFLIPGLVCFSLVAVPWYWLMYAVHGNDFIDTFLGLHNYLRATVAEHPRDNVFYYYFVLFPLSIMPWTGVAIKSVLSLPLRKATDHFAFLTIWPTVIILFYTLMATKYPTYVFPAIFPVALLSGAYMNGLLKTNQRQPWLWLTGPAVLFIGILAVGSKFFLPVVNAAMLYGIALLSAAVLLWVQFKGKHTRLPVAAGLLVAIFSMTMFYCGLIPLAGARSAKSIVQNVPKQDAVLASYGDYSTSAVFYSGYIMPRLIEKSEVDKVKSVWSGKYTMPTMTLESFEAMTKNNSRSFIIVKENNQLAWQNTSLAEHFYPVARQDGKFLYRRRIAIP
ncbi:MAG: glycosyltransferase family 39 protein [Veillonellales bacterium]